MTETLDRRSVLKKGLVLGGVGTAAGLLASASGAGCASAQESRALELDVACLGDTFRMIPVAGNAEGDLRGNTFSVEGLIYPDGTIPDAPENDFDPASERAIGHWLCRGWFLLHPGRTQPHVVTTQEYILGVISDDNVFPVDSLVSSGLEGPNPDSADKPALRSVIGGTGDYAAATGVVRQLENGTNTTRIEDFDANAANFRFTFSLLVPELDPLPRPPP